MSFAAKFLSMTSLTGSIYNISCIIALLFGFSASVHGQEIPSLDTSKITEGGWRIASIVFVENNERVDDGVVIFTADSSSPGLIFRCRENYVEAGISLEGVNLREIYSQLKRPRFRTVKFRIGDSEVIREQWAHYQSANIAFPSDPLMHRKIFNAIVRDETLTVSVGRHKDVLIDSPPAHPKKFNQFLGSCELGTKPTD